MRIFLTNLGKYTEGELVGLWLELPYTKEELDAALTVIGIGGRYEEYFITDFDDALGLDIDEYECLSELNDVADMISSLDASDLQVLQAVIELDSPKVSDMINVINRLNEYTLFTDIHNDWDLGYYHIHEAGCYDLNTIGNLVNYLDYEAYGRDMRLNASGGFTSMGWLEY